MQTAAAVFLAFAVIYFGMLALPAEHTHRWLGYSAQAVHVSGAVATFAAMYAHRLGPLSSAAVFAALGVLTALAALGMTQCWDKVSGCQDGLPMHAVVFTSGFLTGAAAYLGFGLASLVGMPLWATIVATALLAPVLLTVVLPVVTRTTNQAYKKLE